MPSQFIRSVTRGKALQLQRVNDGSWSVVVPLPGNVTDPLNRFDSSFGYPIDFACSCSPSSTDECTCREDEIFSFWEEATNFIFQYFDRAGHGVSLDDLRRRFVQFYVDLPSLPLSSDGGDAIAFERRRNLISEAGRIYKNATGLVPQFVWMDWPALSDGERSEDTGDVFTDDMAVLSRIRSAINRHFTSKSLPDRTRVDDLVSGRSGVFLLQLASVLDQLNLIELSESVLDFFHNHELSYLPSTPQTLITHVNRRLSRNNRQKDKFFSIQKRVENSPQTGGLERLREKLSRMLMSRRRPWDAYHQLDPNMYQPASMSPVDLYADARRSLRGKENSPWPKSPFKASFLKIDWVDEPVQTQSQIPTEFPPIPVPKLSPPPFPKPVGGDELWMAEPQAAVLVDSDSVDEPVVVSRKKPVKVISIPRKSADSGRPVEPVVTQPLVRPSNSSEPLVVKTTSRPVTGKSVQENIAKLEESKISDHTTAIAQSTAGSNPTVEKSIADIYSEFKNGFQQLGEKPKAVVEPSAISSDQRKPVTVVPASDKQVASNPLPPLLQEPILPSTTTEDNLQAMAAITEAKRRTKAKVIALRKPRVVEESRPTTVDSQSAAGDIRNAVVAEKTRDLLDDNDGVNPRFAAVRKGVEKAIMDPLVKTKVVEAPVSSQRFVSDSPVVMKQRPLGGSKPMPARNVIAGESDEASREHSDDQEGVAAPVFVSRLSAETRKLLEQNSESESMEQGKTVVDREVIEFTDNPVYSEQALPRETRLSKKVQPLKKAGTEGIDPENPVVSGKPVFTSKVADGRKAGEKLPVEVASYNSGKDRVEPEQSFTRKDERRLTEKASPGKSSVEKRIVDESLPVERPEQEKQAVESERSLYKPGMAKAEPERSVSVAKPVKEKASKEESVPVEKSGKRRQEKDTDVKSVSEQVRPDEILSERLSLPEKPMLQSKRGKVGNEIKSEMARRDGPYERPTTESLREEPEPVQQISPVRQKSMFRKTTTMILEEPASRSPKDLSDLDLIGPLGEQVAADMDENEPRVEELSEKEDPRDGIPDRLASELGDSVGEQESIPPVREVNERAPQTEEDYVLIQTNNKAKSFFQKRVTGKEDDADETHSAEQEPKSPQAVKFESIKNLPTQEKLEKLADKGIGQFSVRDRLHESFVADKHRWSMKSDQGDLGKATPKRKLAARMPSVVDWEAQVSADLDRELGGAI